MTPRMILPKPLMFGFIPINTPYKARPNPRRAMAKARYITEKNLSMEFEDTNVMAKFLKS